MTRVRRTYSGAGAWLAIVAFLLESVTATAGGNNFPEIARGHGAVPPSGAFDTVNRFNGALSVTIPIGSFKAGTLDYALQATYNSNSWDMELFGVNIPGTQPYIDHAFPSQSNNAGLGWMVSLGELYEPANLAGSNYFWRNHSNRDYLYVAPDGKETVFSCDPNTDPNCTDNSSAAATVFYSSGYELRLRKANGGMELDFPDGTTHRFEQKVWAPCPKSNDTCFKLVWIQDRAGNTILLNYTNEPAIVISDTWCNAGGCGSDRRRHKIRYRQGWGTYNRPNATDIGFQDWVVASVTLNDNDAVASSTFTFFYNDEGGDSGPRIWPREFPSMAYAGEQFSGNLPLNLLTKISVPELPPFTFGYFNGQAVSTNTATGFRGVGAMAWYGTPSGLRVDFGYREWRIPKPCGFGPISASQGGIPVYDDPRYSLLWGVGTRVETDFWSADGSPIVGTTNYSSAEASNSGCGDGRPLALSSTMTGPENAQGHRLQDVRWFNTSTDGSGEFGLPFTRSWSRYDSAVGTTYLSSQTLDCTSSSCNTLTETFVRYSLSYDAHGNFQCESGDSPICVRRHATEVASATRWWSTGQVHTQRRSSFDGLGHWRSVEEEASGYSANPKKATTVTLNTFMPSISNDAGDGGINLGSGSPFWSKVPNGNWLTGLIKARSVTIDGVEARTSFEQDGRGLTVAEVKGWDNTWSQGRWFVLGADGQATSEVRNAGTLLHTSPAPSGPQIVYSYNDRGMQTAATLSNGGNTLLIGSSLVYDATGRVTSETSADGRQRKYENLDLLGRPGKISGDGIPSITVTYKSAPIFESYSADDRQISRSYDGHGRVYKEVVGIPESGSERREVTRTFHYDAAGNLKQKRTTGGSVSATETAQFDALGRVTSSTDAANVTTTYVYTADESVLITAGDSAASRKKFDSLGRLVEEQFGLTPTGSSPIYCETYGYDAWGNRTSAKRYTGSCSSGSAQERFWEYSPGGILLSSTDPESGKTEFGGFNAFGLPTTKSVNNQETLALSYDFAGRSNTTSWNSTMIVDRDYGMSSCSNSYGKHCEGKITSQTRKNRPSPTSSAPSYDVIQRFEYAHPSGNVSAVNTEIQYPGPNGSTKQRIFHQAYNYNEFGERDGVTYPVLDCSGCTGDPGPPRSSIQLVEQGRPIAVDFDEQLIGSLTYDAIGRANNLTLFSGGSALLEKKYEWNTTQQKLNLLTATKGTTSLWTSGTFEYDGRGNILSLSTAAQKWQYGYDLVNRLTSATLVVNGTTLLSQTFGYDAFDNLASRITTGISVPPPPSFDSSHSRLGSPYQYDNAGRLIRDGCLAYAYDQLGALVAVSRDPASSAPECDVSLKHLYDADGLRVLTICEKGCKGEAVTPPPQITFDVSASSIILGDSVDLSWNVTPPEATTCAASGADDWSGTKSLTGKITLSPAADTTYTLTCSGPGGQAVRSRNVKVLPPSPLVCLGPRDAFETPGSNISLDARCSGGRHGTTYLWQRSTDGTAWQAVANGGRFTNADTKTLNISQSETNDSGFYRVIAMEPLKDAVTSPAGRLQIAEGIPMGETGTATAVVVAGAFTVNFRTPFSDAPIVIVTSIRAASTDGAPLTPIVTNVWNDQFRGQLYDSRTAEKVSGATVQLDYMAVRQGFWTLDGGAKLRAWTSILQTVKGQSLPDLSYKGWTSVSYFTDTYFPSPPVLLAQLQSGFGAGGTCIPEFRHVRLRRAQNKTADAAVEFSDNFPCADILYHYAPAGFIAFEPGAHVLGANSRLIAQKTGVSVTDKWKRVPFSVGLGPNPVVVATVTSNNESDSIVVGTRGHGANGVAMSVLEDRTRDNEVTHSAEQVHFIATNGPITLYSEGSPGEPSCPAPSIQSSPQSTSVALGGSLSISVVAQGATSLQWLHDGVDIPGATSTTLTIRPFQSTNVGKYRVRAENACGEVAESATAQVTVATSCSLPSISGQPTSLFNVYPGEAVTFQVAATGQTGFQWQKEGIDLAGQNAPSLPLIASTSSAGSYSVKVVNACGTIASQAAILDVTTQTSFKEPGIFGKVFQAEDFDVGGEGVAYHECLFDTSKTSCVADNKEENTSYTYRTDASGKEEFVDIFFDSSNGRKGIGWPMDSEWTEYSYGASASNVPHVVDMMVAADAGQGTNAKVRFGRAGDAASAEVNVRDTGGWDSFRLLSSRAPVPFSFADRQVLRATMVGNGFNLDWLRVRPATRADLTIPLFEDHFTTIPANRLLNATSTAGKTWAAGSGFKFDDKRRITPDTATTGNATVPYTISAGKAGSVEAAIRPLGSTWIGVGFGKDSGDWPAGAGHVWARITPGGKYNVLVNGSSSISGGDRTLPAEANFSASDFAQVRLTFNPARNLARLYVNGVAVGPALSTATSVPIDVQRAGVAVASTTAGQSMFDDVAISSVDVADGCEPPSITVAPGPRTVTLGQALTLSVTAAEATTYQWRKDGRLLPDTGAQLTRPNVSMSDAGRYEVIVSNACGAETAPPATVDIFCRAPTISVPPPSSLTVPLGQTLSLSGAATGTGSISYQWLHGSVAIAGASTAALSVESVTPDANGQYYLRATNTCGSITSSPTNVLVSTTVPGYEDCAFGHVCMYLDGVMVATTSPAGVPSPHLVDFGVTALGTGAVKEGMLVYNEYPGSTAPVEERAGPLGELENLPFQIRWTGAFLRELGSIPAGTSIPSGTAVPISVEFVPETAGTYSKTVSMRATLAGAEMAFPASGIACDAFCVRVNNRLSANGEAIMLPKAGSNATATVTITPPNDLAGQLTLELLDASAGSAIVGSRCLPGSTATQCNVSLPGAAPFDVMLTLPMDSAVVSAKAARLRMSFGEPLVEIGLLGSDCSGEVCVYRQGKRVAKGSASLGRMFADRSAAIDLQVVNATSRQISGATVSSPWVPSTQPLSLAPGGWSLLTIVGKPKFGRQTISLGLGTASDWNSSLDLVGFRRIPVTVGRKIDTVEIPATR